MLTLFDNGATPAVERRSRGLVLELDEQAMAARMVAQYAHPGRCPAARATSSCCRTATCSWAGAKSRASEFDRSGRILFDALLGRQYECYRAFRQPWAGTPAEQPAIAVTGRPGASTVHASWNGATGVRAWQLLAGSSADAMSALSSAPASGFETAIRAHGAGPCFAAAALDARDAVIGRTPIVTAA